MDKYLQEFLNELTSGGGYGYIANHYYEFTKDELKDIILEIMYPLVKDGENLQMVNRQTTLAGIKDELAQRWDYDEAEQDDYSINKPCDNSGYCAGASCSQYYKECRKEG